MTKFTWDEVKRTANFEKHGFDFEDVIFFGWADARIAPARPSRYGGRRMLAIGYFGGEKVAVIYAPLGTEAISIISFRPAGRKERRWLDEKAPNPN